MVVELIPLSVSIIVILVILLIYFCSKTPIYFVENEGIFIKDFLYPSNICNETIKSVKLCDELPKVILRTNGYGGVKKWKGFFQIKKEKSRSAMLYLENYVIGPFIEIETTNRLYYINLKNAEQTRQLFDEIMSTVKFVDGKNLIFAKDNAPIRRSVIALFVFVFVVTALALLPTII